MATATQAATGESRPGEKLAKDYSSYSDLPIFPLPKSEKHEKQLRECGTYEFMNVEEPNGPMVKTIYGSTKKKGVFEFFHGGRYRIPRFLKEHMESRGTPIWKWHPDGTGKMHKVQHGFSPRYQFREVYE